MNFNKKRFSRIFYFFLIFNVWIFVVVGAGSTLSGVIFNVRDFGATGGGEVLDTESIQAAIDTCAKTGGKVLLPSGTYLSGTIFMKSNVTLEISEGAVLLGSTDINDYPEMLPKIRSYTDIYLRHSLIYGEDLENIAIVGRGTIDGQGSEFEVITLVKPHSYKNRPYIIRFIKCRNVLVQDLRMQNSAMWMQHYFACENVMIRGINVYNHCNKNNDMIDIDCCKNVVVSDCIGDSDDDAITIKSTSGIISENITVTNCIVSSHCNAVKCGTESHGGFKNIAISNIVVKPSKHQTTIYGVKNGKGGIILAIVDGGILDGVTISNVRIDGPRVPIFLRLGNRGRVFLEGMEKPPVGKFRNVSINNIIASGADKTGCSITGLPGHPVENISLSNVRIHYIGGGTYEQGLQEVHEKPESYPESTVFGDLPCYGFFIRHARGISFSNVDLTFESVDHRPALICDDVQGLDLFGFRAQGTRDSESLIRLKDTKDVFITGSRLVTEVGLFLSIVGKHTERISIIGNDLRLADKKYMIGDGAVKKELLFESNLKEH